MKLGKNCLKQHSRTIFACAVVFLVSTMTLAACGNSSTTTQSQTSSKDGIHKIKHIVVIMQENRSFDSYFGTYPGADGIPMQNGETQ